MKRIVSLLLALVMLCGLLPQGAMATETPDTAGDLCNHKHDDSCYTVECTHVHGECGYVEENPEIPCSHDCAQDTACSEKILNCTHVHDDSCGYVETKEDTDSDVVITPDEEIGSGTPDSAAPVLNSIILSTETVTIPGMIEITVDATDDVSGLDYAEVQFYSEETGKRLNVFANSTYFDKDTGAEHSYADGLLHATLEIDQYVESGTFVVQMVKLCDIADNNIYYHRDDALNLLPDTVKNLSFRVFNTIPDVTTSVSKSDFVDAVDKAADNAYIAADYSGDATMPKAAFEAIAGTNKTIDLISEGITWRFEGSDITEEIKDIDLKVEIQKVEDDSSASGDAIEGNLNGNPGVVMKFPENGTLPGKATIQVKVDYAMREYLGSDQGLCVYYYNNQTGELELIASDLKVINDTYVEFPITHCSYYVLAPMLNSGSTSGNSGTCGANLTWEFDETTKVLTISGTGPMRDFTLDGTGYLTKATDTPWYDFQYEILEIVIESGVTTVGRGAFAGMDALIVVSLPETLTSIGDYAFHADTSLKALDIPSGVTYLGDYSLCCCPNLVTVSLPNGITEISTSLFDQTWPNAITIPAAVTTVGSKAFAYGSIGEIVFTGNAPTFADDAFHSQTTTVRYPKNDATWANIVTQNYGGTITWLEAETSVGDADIGDPVFTSASGTWGNNITWTLDATGLLTVSGSGAMEHCSENPNMNSSAGVFYPWHAYASGITKLVVEDGITALNSQAFSQLAHLESVILPDSLLDMQDNTFTNCVKLKDVTLGTGVTRIGQSSFGGCTSLTSITIPGNVRMIDYYAFNGCKNLKNVTISDGVTVIWKTAFRGCSSLTSIDLPDSVESIGTSAFEGCTGLTEVTLPKNLLTLYGHVFYNCSNLKTLYFEGNAVDFHPYALLNLTATAYYPGNNPTWTAAVRTNYGGNITWAATAISGQCGENLTWTFSGDTLTISGTGDMYDYSQDQTNSAPWTSFSDDIKKLVIEEGTTGIGDYAFADCSAIENASFPSTLTRVGEYPFNRFSRPNGNVYYRVFWSEVNQTVRQWSQIQFEADSERFLGGDSTDFIEHAPIIESGKYGDRVYWEMNENGTIEFFGHGNMDEFWATGSWLYDLSAKTILITEGITNIGMNAFESYGEDPLSVSLETVKIASTVTRVEEMAFAGCQALKTITFTGDAPSFGDYCFRDVTATAFYPAGNATWTTAVMQNYDGNITWVPYCLEHSFGEWITEGTNSHRTCIYCGYTEHKVVTDSGDVEIEIPEQPDLDVEVDPVLPTEDNYILVEKALENTDYEVLKAFDINLKNSDGVHVQPNGTVKVKLPLDWSQNGNYKVYRVNDDGTLTDMNAYRQGSHMVFETDHFSIYVIAEERVVTAPTAKTLTYTGSAQALVNAGSVTCGTLQYSLDGVTYAADIPTATNAGTYTIYYKVEGSQEEAQTVSATIAKAMVTITADDKTAAVGAAKPTLTYTVTGLKGTDKLTSNPTLTCNATMSTTGEYEITVSGGDAGANYEIQRVNGKLSVKKEHKITVASATNGTVSISPEKAIEGTQVTITVTPKSGYKLSTLVVKDAAGNSYTVSTDNNGKYYFIMPAVEVTVTATFTKTSTSIADTSNPKTGDDFNMVLWSGMAMTSLLCMAAMVLGKKKHG